MDQFRINDGAEATNSREVTVSLSAKDNRNVVSEMRFAVNGDDEESYGDSSAADTLIFYGATTVSAESTVSVPVEPVAGTSAPAKVGESLRSASSLAPKSATGRAALPRPTVRGRVVALYPFPRPKRVHVEPARTTQPILKALDHVFAAWGWA